MLALKKIALVGAATALSFQYVLAEEEATNNVASTTDDGAEDDFEDESSEGGAAAGGVPNIPGLEGMDMEELMKNLPEGMDMEQLMAQLGEGQGEAGMPDGGSAPPKAELVVVEDAEKLQTALAARTPSTAIYVFRGAQGKSVAEKLVGVKDLFGQVMLLPQGDVATLTVYKGRDEVVEYTGEGGVEDFEAVNKWAVENRVPIFGQIDGTNFEIYFEAAKKGLFWACFDPTKNDDQVAQFNSAFVEASKAHRASAKEIYPFVWLNVADFEEHAKNDLGCKTFPTIVLQRGDLMSEAEDVVVDKFLRSFEGKEDTLTADAIGNFFADIESGALKAEPIPDPLDAMDDDEEDEEEKAAPAQPEENAEL